MNTIFRFKIHSHTKIYRAKSIFLRCCKKEFQLEWLLNVDFTGPVVGYIIFDRLATCIEVTRSMIMV